MKFAFTIQYSGNSFFGFQRQKDYRSVQQIIEEAIFTILRKKIRIYPAGRTDTGVHAAGQVIHFSFDYENSLLSDMRRFIYAVNSVLPDDVSFIYGKPVSEDFHARFSCKGRDYLYRILNSPYRMALYRETSHWVRTEMDIQKMREAAERLIGEHDFAAFTKAFYQKKGEKTVRRIDDIQIIENYPFIDFYYKGSGFLHNMIRIITGTLLQAGKGQITSDEIAEILKNKKRDLAGQTIPACGLFFLNAYYDEYETPVELLPFYDLQKKN